MNISSVAGRLVSAGHGIYAATKYALEALSEAVAIETRRLGIRVIVIEPGFISTPILDKGIAIEVGEGPYAPHLRRMQALYRNARGGAEPPSAVAEVIADALDDPTPTLSLPRRGGRSTRHQWPLTNDRRRVDRHGARDDG